MMRSIHRQTLQRTKLGTMDWFRDRIMDWGAAGTAYAPDGASEQLQKYHFAFGFDSAISTTAGKYVFLYKKLGTKGLLLKEGEVLREINRSYYQAEVYEYPAAFITTDTGQVLLAHCPKDYNRLDFEDVETGEILTDSVERQPQDIFHSRLELSPNGRYLLSKAWVWQPWDVVEAFEVAACLANPCLLDQGLFVPNSFGSEICTASFIDDERVVLYASAEEGFDDEQLPTVSPDHLAIWHLPTNTVSGAVLAACQLGTLYAINERYCWDVFGYPKVIDLHTGEVVAKVEDIFSG